MFAPGIPFFALIILWEILIHLPFRIVNDLANVLNYIFWLTVAGYAIFLFFLLTSLLVKKEYRKTIVMLFAILITPPWLFATVLLLFASGMAGGATG